MGEGSEFWQWNVGVLLGVLGLAVALPTVWAAFRAKSAAQAAQEAGPDTVRLVEGETTLADLAHLEQLVRETQTALRGLRWETALIRTAETISGLVRLRARPSFVNDEKLTEIQTQVVLRRKLETALERKMLNPDANLAVDRANASLAELVTLLSERLEQVRTTSHGDAR